MPLRVAVVGVGWAGTRHVEAISEVGTGIEVACLVDPDLAHANSEANRLGVSGVVADYRSVLSDSSIDAFSICTPHHLHMPIALAAAAAGKHILCEKPLAMSVDDGLRMVKAAEAGGVILFVAENECYTPQARFLHESLNAAVGNPVSVSVRAGFRTENFEYEGRRSWLTDPQQGGTGTWMLHGIHTVAQIRHIFGEVVTVFMVEHHATSNHRPTTEATMSGALVLNSGAVVLLTQTTEVDLDDFRTYVIGGDQGSLLATTTGYTIQGQTRMQPYPTQGMSSYAREIVAFMDAIEYGGGGPTSGRSELRSLAVVQAGYESSERGIPVDLRQRFGPEVMGREG